MNGEQVQRTMGNSIKKQILLSVRSGKSIMCGCGLEAAELEGCFFISLSHSWHFPQQAGVQDAHFA